MLTGIAVGAVLLVVSLALVWRIWLRDTETPVTLADAVADFRSEPTTSAVATSTPLARPHPRPGVYSYATVGRESIDALGGTAHEYPSVTTITARPSSCGMTYTWTPLEERSERIELCWGGDGSVAISGYTSLHRFFGQDDRLAYECEPPVVLLPGVPSLGDLDAGSCSAPPLVETISVSIVSLDEVDVGGTRVAAATVALTIELDATDDSTSGVATAELRLAMDSGLILRWEETTRSVSDSAIGDVDYDESFVLELTTLEPET